jgi:hypothetical protein
MKSQYNEAVVPFCEDCNSHFIVANNGCCDASEENRGKIEVLVRTKIKDKTDPSVFGSTI